MSKIIELRVQFPADETTALKDAAAALQRIIRAAGIEQVTAVPTGDQEIMDVVQDGRAMWVGADVKQGAGARNPGDAMPRSARAKVGRAPVEREEPNHV